MARIYRRPESAIWQCCYRLPGSRRPVRESTKTADQRAARRFLEARIRETGIKRTVGPAAERVRFADLEKLIVDDYKNNRQRVRNLDYALRHLRGRFARFRAIEITGPEIAAHTADELAAGASPASVNRQLATLRRMFRLGLKHGTVGAVPYVKLLPEHNARQTAYSHAEYVAIRCAMPEQFRDFVTALYVSGIRRTQLAMVEPRDVNLGTSELTMRAETTKNRRAHTVPLVGEFGDVIRRAWAKRRLDCAYLFQDSGRPFVYRDGSLTREFRNAWDAARASTGLAGRIMHDFRRSAAINFDQSGDSEQVWTELMGWSSGSAMPKRYNIVDRERKADAMRRRDEFVTTLPTEQRTERL